MKFVLISLAYVAVVLGADFNGGDQGWYCGILSSEDCMTHNVEEKCGTDGVTYRNMCDLGQHHCRNNTINQAHEGPCTSTTAAPDATTRSPDQVVHGSEVILDFQCVLLSHRACEHSINEKICGNDGRTYSDFCEYEKARCTHRDLHVAKLGDCNA